MADPRPSADDPLIIFGSVSLPARQGPSTVNPATYSGGCGSGGIPSFGEPSLGCSCLCCPPMPPGCPIGPLPCECPCDLWVPFPPDPAQGGGGGGISCEGTFALSLTYSTCQVLTAGTCLDLLFNTVEYAKGFTVSGTVTCVTIPRTGLWAVNGRACVTASIGVNDTSYLYLFKCTCCVCNFVKEVGPSVFSAQLHLPTVKEYTAGTKLKLAVSTSTNNGTVGSSQLCGQNRFSLILLSSC